MSYFTVPSHILMGQDALEEAERYLMRCGKRALIVTGKHVGTSSMMDSLKQTLEKINIPYVVYDGITGEPTQKMIEEGLKWYRSGNCDFCIGIGGGSPLDSAKAIAVMSVHGGKLSQYSKKVIGGNIPPIVAIPTTSGTGSEGTKFTVITDEEKGVKMLLKGDGLLPTIAILQPEFSMTMPKSVTAATGLDALTHAVEAYTSKKATPLTDIFAISAVKRIMKYLPLAYSDGYDFKAREEMALAALEAGICINNSSVTIVHGMSRPIGALFHVSHGISNAMLLTGCLSHVLEGAYDRFANLAQAIGIAIEDISEKEASERFLEQVGELCKKCKVPTLKEYGIKKEEFYSSIEKMAVDAIASGSPDNTRKSVSVEDCISIYKKIYEE